MSIVTRYQLQSSFLSAQQILFHLSHVTDWISFYSNLHQVRVILSEVEQHLRTQNNRFGKQFPSVLLLHTFTFLKPGSFYLYRMVCKSWCHILTSRTVETMLASWMRYTLPSLDSVLQVAKRVILSDHSSAIEDVAHYLVLSMGSDDVKIKSVMDLDLLPRWLRLLSHSNSDLVVKVLHILGKISSGNDEQTQMLIDSKFLSFCSSLLLHPNPHVVSCTLWILSNITCGNSLQIQAVIDANLIPLVIRHLRSKYIMISKEASWVLHHFVRGGSLLQISYVVNQQVCKPLIFNLTVAKLQELSLTTLAKILKTVSNQEECIRFGLLSQLDLIMKPSLNENSRRAVADMLLFIQSLT